MCGVFGYIGSKSDDAARIVHIGLWALQHRGQDSSGISATDGKTIRTHKGVGLVAHVYDEAILESLKGYMAIGHNRYPTSGGVHAAHAQPIINDNLLALAHNGNLPSTTKLEEFLKKNNIDITGKNDSELMHEALRFYLRQGSSIEDGVRKCFPLFSGVFSLLLLTKDKMVAVRDEYGIRPLSLGKLNGGFIVTSETCALSTINAQYIRDVKPAEMVVIDKDGLKSYQLTKGKQKLDIFEFVYFARPDSMLLGKSVNEVRRNLGKRLAKEYPLKADVVIPVPDSAIPAALGYSEASGVPFDTGFIKNRYIHRTFIRPAQKLREADVQLKLNPLPQVLAGKDVIIIDDSIVRGTTSKKIVEMVRKAGAKKVYLLISSPPYTYPDFYGIDTPKQEDLIAARMKLSEIEKFIGADAVKYLSFEGLIEATGLSEDLFSTSCFTGVYPVDIGERMLEIRKV